MTNDNTDNSYEPDGSSLTVFAIVQSVDGTISVELAAATEMSFDLALMAGDNYEQAIADLCKLAPHLLRLDSDTMESMDGGFGVDLRKGDVVAVEAFVKKYRRYILNNTVACGAFGEL